MNQMKKVIALILALSTVFCLTACGNTQNGETETTNTPEQTNGQETTAAPEETTEETTTEDNGMIQYTVTVVDEAGTPIAGAIVQLCLDTCIPGVTDENGVASFTVAEAEYKVSFLSMPEGYSAEAENFYFEDGAHDMTITLKAEA